MNGTKYFLIIFFVGTSFLSSAQGWVGLELGGNLSQMRYVNSDGVIDRDMSGVPGVTAAASYFYQLNQGNKNSPTTLGLKAGYKSVRFRDNASSILTTWELQNLSGSFLLRQHVGSARTLALFYGGGATIDYLLNGTQTTGFNQSDLGQSINSLNFSLLLETGLIYNISDLAFSTFRLGYSRGLKNLEKDPGQKAFVHGWELSIAVFFILK